MASAYQVIKGILVTVASLAVWYYVSTHLKFELDVVAELPSSISEIEYLRKELRYKFRVGNPQKKTHKISQKPTNIL